jgi:hypothetical protein
MQRYKKYSFHANPKESVFCVNNYHIYHTTFKPVIVFERIGKVNSLFAEKLVSPNKLLFSSKKEAV